MYKNTIYVRVNIANFDFYFLRFIGAVIVV